MGHKDRFRSGYSGLRYEENYNRIFKSQQEKEYIILNDLDVYPSKYPLMQPIHIEVSCSKNNQYSGIITEPQDIPLIFWGTNKEDLINNAKKQILKYLDSQPK